MIRKSLSLTVLSVLILLWFFVVQVHAQQIEGAPSRLPKFEVASVRIVDRGPYFYYKSPSGSAQFTLQNAFLANLLKLAFGVSSDHVLGKPAWYFSTFYEIRAKTEGDVGVSDEDLKLLIQELLEERFHLRYHLKRQIVQGYALVIAKGGSRLQESRGGEQRLDGHQTSEAGVLTARNATTQGIAELLGHFTGYSDVTDETGLKGSYDFRLEFAPMEATDSSLPSILTAMHEKLGLEFVKRKIPVVFITIDHVDQIPTEN